MGFHETIRNMIKENKSKVELLQWASVSAVSSLIYSEFIRRFRRKMIGGTTAGGTQLPSQRINIPTINSVKNLVDHGSPLMERLSNELIDGVNAHPLIQQYRLAPELTLFQPTQIEFLKCIFDSYMIPTIAHEIPNAIAKKFDLYNDRQTLFYEDRSIDLFDRAPINDDQIAYIIEETVLQLLILMPSVVKEVEDPEDYTKIHFTENSILTIGNSNALCPIHINKKIYESNGEVLKLLMFVTGSSHSRLDKGSVVGCHHDEIIIANFKTNPFNYVTRSYFTKMEDAPKTEESNIIPQDVPIKG